MAGTTLNASPERRMVGTAVSRSGPPGSLQASTSRATAARASSALRPCSGAEPECAERPCASTRSVAAALRFTITASSPASVALAALEAQTRVEVREARRVRERRGSPFLVVHEQHRHLGVQLGPLRELAHQRERQRHPALHVHAARAGEPVAVTGERPVRVVVDDRVEVPQQHEPPLPAAAQGPHEVAGMVGSRALEPLHLGLGRQEGSRQRHALLGSLDVARRRRHGHERLQLALRRERHAGGHLDHSSGAWK